MSNVPTNLIPTRITGLPEYTGTSTLGYIPYILDGRTYKVQFGQIAAVGAVPSTRVIAAGTGLTGGGDLSENRVISIAPGGVGFDQLAVSGATAGTYGNSGNIPVVTVDSKGRVTNVETVPLVANGYVPTSRLVSAGVGLLGGGSLTDNITLSVNFYASAPQALGSATPGVSNAAARGDHVHPAVDLSDANQTQGALPLGRGGTGDALSPVAGAVVYSTGTKFALADPGIPGQVLTSAGTGEPYWQTIEGTGTVTSVAVLTGNGFAGTVNNPNTVAEITLSTTVTGLVKGNGTALSAAVAGTDYVAPGAITGSGLTMATDRLLGRTTALTGAVEQITVGSGLSLSAGVLSSTVGGTVTSVAASGGSTGLTFSGSPITTSGTLTLGGTLAVASGGTGATTAAGARTNLGAAASGANSDITSMSGITGAIGTPTYIQFDSGAGTPLAAGRLWYDQITGSLNMGMGGGNITQQIGEELFVYGRASAAITQGQVVIKTGAVGASGTITFAPAPLNTTDSLAIIGVATENIPLNGFGRITSFGVVRGFNTTGSPYGETWADGDILYYNPNYVGGLTNVKPSAPNQKTEIGIVINAGSGGSGSIQVEIIHGTVLGGTDSNVQLSAPTNNDLLQYSSSLGYWRNIAPSSVAVGTATNLAGGAANRIAYQTGAGATGFIAAPTIANTFLEWSGSAFQWSSNPLGTVTSVAASGGTTGLTFSGSPITTSGTLTLGGTLAIANGGTGATTAADARTNLGLGTAAVLNAGVANGVATLDGAGTVPTSQLPAAVLGALNYQGVWNASTNTPTLTSSVGTKGYYYVVDVAGSTNLNGITDWKIGDWAVYNGTVWQKIDNTDSVTSVNGYTGAVVLSYTDVGAPSATGIGASGTWGINVTGTAANVTGTVAVANGGTGQTSYTNGQLLIGNTATGGLNKATLTAGSGVSITNGNGSITIAATGSGGTVTSVDVSGGTTGLTTSGGPITGSGTITLAGTLNVANGGTGATSLSSGYLLKGNGTSAVSASVVYDNGTNVGIGTAAPGTGTRLNVAGRGLFTGGSYDPGDGTASGVSISYDTGSNVGIIGAVQTGVSEREMRMRGNTLTFFTNGANERMRVTSAGNVGIGTNNPASLLDINGLLTTGNITVRGDGVEGGQITFNNLGNTAGPLTLDVDNGGNGRLFTTVNNASLILGQLVGTGGIITLNTASSERMRITAAGLVGIGTSTPSFLLHGVQNGNAEFRVSATNSGTNSAGLTVENEGNRNWNLWANRSTDNFIIGANSRANDFIVINGSSANVGIGTSAPAVRLDIRGGDLQVSRGASGVAADAAINFGSNTNNYIYSGNSNNIMAFATNGSERVRITSGGDIGVGTSAPLTRLFVETPANIGAPFAFSGNANGVYPPSVFGGSFGYNFSAGGAEVDFWNGWTGASGTQGGFAFRRQTGASSQNLLMLIRGDGNVGIGTSSPASSLQVVGAGRFGAGPTDGTNAALALYNDGTGASIEAFQGNNATVKRNLWLAAYGGNVGIGTTTTTRRLEVVGPTITTATPSTYAVGIANTGGANGDITLGSDASYGYIQSWSKPLYLNKEGNNVLFGSGNVGIGLTNPTFKLQVNGTFWTASNVQFYDQDGFRFSSASAISAMRFGSAYTGESTAEWAYNRATAITSLSVGNTGSALNERLRVDASGNVAIGTSTTVARFRVAAGGVVNAPALGNVANYPAFFSNSDTGYGLGIGTNSVDGHVWLQAQRSDSAVAYNLTMQEAGGSVGIGTSSPNSKLDVVAASGYVDIRVRSNTTQAFVAADTSAITMGTYNAVPYLFSTNNTERMRITAAGDVGIGTSSPNNRLTVVGGGVTQYKASGDNNAFLGSTSDTSNNYLRLQNSVNTVDLTCSNGSAYLNSAQSVLWFGTNGVERMRLSGSELLVGTTTGGRTVCINAADNWIRQSNASRSWLIGMGTTSTFYIWDETGGGPRFWVDTSGSINAPNSFFLGSGANNDNKIEIGAGRTGNNYAYIDLIGDTTYTDYGLRLIRGNGGPNATSQLVHRGTGDMYITAQDAATLYFQTNSTTRAYFQSDGTMVMNGALLVGRNTTGSNVNTNNDTGSFSVRGDASNAASISFHRTGAFAMNMGLGTDAIFRMGGWSMSSNCFQMDGSGNLTMLGNVTAYSDARIKKDVETIGSALDLVSKMRGVRYTRIDSGKRGVGVIAQEMLEVLPEVVQQGVGDDDTLSVAYGNLVGVLIEAVKELTARVAELEGK